MKGAILVALVGLFVTAEMQAFDVRFDGSKAGTLGQRLSASRTVLARKNGVVLHSASEMDIAAANTLRRQNDGGGADVDNVLLAQIGYSDPTDGNVLLVQFDEVGAPNAGIGVLINGSPLGAVPSGTPAIVLTLLDAGPTEVGLIGLDGAGDPVGSPAIASHIVVDAQPFDDPEASCVQAEDPDSGECGLLVTLTNGGALPALYSVSVNGAFLGTVAAAAENQIFITGLPNGVNTLDVFGILPTAAGTYFGPILSGNCKLDCPEPEKVPALDGLGGLLVALAVLGIGAFALRRRTTANGMA